MLPARDWARGCLLGRKQERLRAKRNYENYDDCDKVVCTHRRLQCFGLMRISR